MTIYGPYLTVQCDQGDCLVDELFNMQPDGTITPDDLDRSSWMLHEGKHYCPDHATDLRYELQAVWETLYSPEALGLDEESDEE